ncbi:Alpha-D-kanosaminyltransferase [Planctomycetes bacterium Poly30]|uniref:Alpha-D-kanosaminyltransferase n=1 Tax=Saltatorellus ferox TaxID=2528018 RepID=A0A518F0N4_9BACT|nr:Alpha-D-kanosaminyltransferase [Planctomycetes bacterium Poly30]
MRVLITSPVFPPDLGGPAVYVPSVGRFLMERGHDVRVIAFCSDPAPQGYPFPVQAISRGPLPIRYLKAFWAVLKAAGWADVVYVQEHLALLHVLAARLRFRPVVIRIMVDGSWEIAHRKGWCDGDNIVQFQGKRYGWKVGLARFLQKRWWGMCSRIICCSEFLRGILVNSYGVAPDKAVTVLNAYHGPKASDVPESREEARADLGLASDRRYVLSICRLMGWKRVDGIIRAIALLKDESVHLLVAGDGDMEAEWRRLSADLGVAERVHFLGNVPHGEIPMYIRAADVFVLNSEYEGLSHTLLEVQALGTPMIASGVCGNPEVVEDGVNGLLVDPDRPEELQAALEKVLRDPELGQRFVEAGFARSGSFDREITFGRVEALLKGAARVR